MCLFFSGYPTADGRIMFHRQIEDRLRTLAPFLKFDDDPYIVLTDVNNYGCFLGEKKFVPASQALEQLKSTLTL